MQKAIEALTAILRFINPLANATKTESWGTWITLAGVVLSAVIGILQAVPPSGAQNAGSAPSADVPAVVDAWQGQEAHVGQSDAPSPPDAD